ncbi:MAG: protein translocase SEC61 complex subunit gamma [Fervidicoccus fontis]|uniref:Protein translocase SEC61 complex subunit gamma n=1 Tax=Fervidicoccus fontis TaxID=683846 RepID=A0A2J6N3A0_9CREN|nr:MAG: protein translocase SEC61 complex subunit gamma [Fervidicoccus fontis]PMB76508.1 MAG: protein translocase SEC61 complex subunit gamma [Fervidicoccus fontis]
MKSESKEESKIKEMLSMWRKILKLSRRPDKEEFNLLLKLNIIGFTLVGTIAYIVHIMVTVVLPAIR